MKDQLMDLPHESGLDRITFIRVIGIALSTEETGDRSTIAGALLGLNDSNLFQSPPVRGELLVSQACEDAGVVMHRVHRLHYSDQTKQSVFSEIENVLLSKPGRTVVVEGSASANYGEDLKIVLVMENDDISTREGYCRFTVSPNIKTNTIGILFEDDKSSLKSAKVHETFPLAHIIEHTDQYGDFLQLFLLSILSVHEKVIPEYFGKLPTPWIQATHLFPRQVMISNRMSRPILVEEIAETRIKHSTIVTRWPCELYLLSAETKQGLMDKIGELLKHTQYLFDTDVMVERLAANNTALPFRLAVVATDKADLTEKLTLMINTLPHRTDERFFHPKGIYFSENSEYRKRGGTAFLFPGQGVQYRGMLKGVMLRFPLLMEWFEKMDGISLTTGIFSRPGNLLYTEKNKSSKLDVLSDGGLAVQVASLALSELLKKLGVIPQAFLGHSFGEFAALIAANVIKAKSTDDVLSILSYLSERFSTMDQEGDIPQGQCYAVTLPPQMDSRQFLASIPADCYLTMDNCPHQKVIWGIGESLGRWVDRLGSQDAICVEIPSCHAYHTPYFHTVSSQLREYYDSLDINPAQIPVYSGLTGELFPSHKKEIIEHACQQWNTTVRFGETLKSIYEQGISNFVDIGPSGKLTGFVRDTLQEQNYTALSVDTQNQADIDPLLRSLGQLYVLGEVDHLSELVTLRGNSSTHHYDKEENKKTVFIREHFELMNLFLDQQQRMFINFSSKTQNAQNEYRNRPKNSSSISTFMLYQPVILQQSKSMMEAVVDLNPEVHTFLKDHFFGWRRSRHKIERQTGLHVMPLAMMIELSASASRHFLGEEWNITELCDIRGLQWVSVDRSGQSITIVVNIKEREYGGCTLDVEIFQAAPDSEVYSQNRRQQQYLAFSARIYLKRSVEYIDPVVRLSDVYGGVSPFTAKEFQDGLFHGDSFRAMEKLVGINQKGLTMRLRVPSQDALFSTDGSEQPLLEVSGPLLDTGSQLSAFFSYAHNSGKLFGLYPYAIERISISPLSPGVGDELTVNAQFHENAGGIISDIDYQDTAGNILIQVTQLASRYFPWPEGWRTVIVRPDYQLVTIPALAEVFSEGALMVSIITEFAHQILDIGGQIWLRVYANSVLTLNEIKQFNALSVNGTRRKNWLLGRVAAKEVAVAWIQKKYGEFFGVADIEIIQDQKGAPLFQLPADLASDLTGEATIPISISHSSGWGVASVAFNGMRSGVDLEPINREIEQSVFDLACNKNECRYIEEHGFQLIWASKEAVAKAAGTGLMGQPKQFEIDAIEKAGTIVTVIIFSQRVTVRIKRHKEMILATCVLSEDIAKMISDGLQKINREEIQEGS